MTNKPKCIYFKNLVYAEDNIKLIQENFSVTYFESPFQNNWKNFSDSKEVEAIFCPLQGRFDAKTLEEFKKLRVLISNTTSIPHIDKKYADQNSIKICALHDEPEFLDTITPTSELTIGLIISASRNIIGSAKAVKSGEWNRKDWGGERMLSRSTLGIIGYGRIGKHVAKIARSMGMRILWYDPYIDIDSKERVASLEIIAQQSNVITLHASANDENKEMIDKKFFDAIETTNYCTFINTARGELVSNSALIDALSSGRVRFGALDTINGEFTERFRNNPGEHELIRYARENDNLLLTPHIAGSTKDAWNETEKYVILKAIKSLEI